jgi:hypothetical protein
MTPPLRFPHLRRVAKGDPIQVAVEGGFVRRKAPESGVVLETREHTNYISDSMLESAGYARRERRATPRIRDVTNGHNQKGSA